MSADCRHNFVTLHQKCRWCETCGRVEIYMREVDELNSQYRPPKWREVDASSLVGNIVAAIDGKIEQHTKELYRLNKLKERYTG